MKHTPEAWTDHSPAQQAATTPAAPKAVTTPPPKKKHRVFWWIFLAIQIFIIWIVTGVHGGQSDNCTGISARDCQNAKEVGTTIGLIVGLWALVAIIVGGTYAAYRPTQRTR
ncbi:hypothetical protein GCM10012285_27790 [Streptomyces kronopolitis]|uniref:Uncharacterized protein n=1 Tax=Streptomyces kronopolitis TaxID=1612435 RepID=A0ABQ2JFN1_9ACTN|nr:hypothetical protein [Streptomyces kronopolitis]GGN44815.1 hypothetical protein GCM10012285_27790 [Streptomyces kronopolitis]